MANRNEPANVSAANCGPHGVGIFLEGEDGEASVDLTWDQFAALVEVALIVTPEIPDAEAAARERLLDALTDFFVAVVDAKEGGVEEWVKKLGGSQ